MSNVPDIICIRLCIYQLYGKCIKSKEWKKIPNCVDRLSDTCKDFCFDSNKIPRCVDCVICENRYLWPGIQICKSYKRKWWKLWRPE